ncbi:leucyl aminopeptidase [soil metagenome]
MLAPGAEGLGAAFGTSLAATMASLGVSGALGAVTRMPTGGAIGAPVLVLVGLGAEVSADTIRQAAGVAARSVPNANDAAVALPARTPDEVAAVCEGLLLGGYRFDRYKSAAEPAQVRFAVLSTDDAASAARARAEVLADAVAQARDWVNTAPADLTPPRFAEELLAAAAGAPGISATSFDEHQLAELGCGAILAVGAGSSAPCRLVELDYRPDGATTHLALVGKGVTFDSGGYHLKSAAEMRTMKDDMAGAAAAAMAVVAIARLGLPIRVSAQLPLVENMISGSAMRPGDVLTTYGGTTVEVTDPDCEGRLIMADALARAVETAPDLIVDIASLTGSIVTALGDRITGVFGTDDVVGDLLEAARRAGEPGWAMPIPDIMTERIHASTIADLVHYDLVQWGGASLAAAFLREFTGSLPWGHLDIGGTCTNTGADRGHLTAGGTGTGVATLVTLAEQLCSVAPTGGETAR